MKRRDFVINSSKALTAAATSDAWLNAVIAGTSVAKVAPHLETYFRVTKSQVDKLLAVALSKGAAFADVFFEYRVTSNLSFEESQIKSVRRGVVQGVGIRAINGDHIGFAFSEDLTMESMMAVAQTAADIANDLTAKIRAKGVIAAPPKNPHLLGELVGGLVATTELAQKLNFIEEANKAARAFSAKILRVNVGFDDEVKHLAYASSEGVAWEDSQPKFFFQTTCVAEDGNHCETACASGGGQIGLEYFAGKRSAAEIAQKAARLAVFNLDAAEPETGIQPVVFGSAESAILLHEAVGHGLEADFNFRKLTNYADRIGEKVASEHCTVIDDGRLENQRGTIGLDDEGHAPVSTVMIERGILRTYLNDRISAKQFGVKATGNGRRQAFDHLPMPRMTNTYLRPGKYDPEEIIKSVRKGIYTTGFTGGQVEIITGDFTLNCSESYLIENGKLTAPLKGVTLNGNGSDVMAKIGMVGTDLKFADGGWSCRKNGQSIPVGLGMPTCKVSEIAVGGTKTKKG